MADVKVKILQIVDYGFPIFVEFELIDYRGISHRFIDKAPVVGNDYDVLSPCDGYMRCIIIDEREKTYIIDTSLPDDIENMNGECQFEVRKEQIISD